MNQHETQQSPYSKVRVLYHLRLENEQGEELLDDQTWALLKAIGDLGTLSKAAEYMKISYRKAWGDLKRTEELLDIQLISKQRGGALGGQSKLTTEGSEFVQAYSLFLMEFEAAAQEPIISFKRKLKKKQ